MGNINMEENKKDNLDGENSTGGFAKMEEPAKWLYCKMPIFGLVTWEHLYFGQAIDA